MINFFSFYLCVPAPARKDFASKFTASLTAKERRERINRQINGKVPTEYVGSGNVALRRQGIKLDGACGCTVCVVYGGDCGNVLMREWRLDEHRARRGVKTRGK